MEATAHANFQRYGRRKVAQVLDEIRGRSLWKVRQLLPGVPRICKTMVSKTVSSAAANLGVRAGRKLDPKEVFIARAWVNQAPMGALKRMLPAPMGRAMTFKRKACHLTIVVTTGSKE